MIGLIGISSPIGPTGESDDFHPSDLSLEKIDGIWIGKSDLAKLATSGKAWDGVMKEAIRSTLKPDLSDQDDSTNVRVLAKALVYVRTGQESYRQDVIQACMGIIGTEEGARSLSLGRELMAYVIAADLVRLPPEKDATFRNFLRGILNRKNREGRSMIQTHEQRPNNWGAHNGASRIATALYLKDLDQLKQAAKVFKGYLGDRQAHTGFRFKDANWWQADSAQPVGINPMGATLHGHNVDGVLPDDQRRAGPFRWPPPKENYVYEALQGLLSQAVMLDRLGYDVWNWSDRALFRAFTWLHDVAEFPAVGDDGWEPYLVNHYYGTDFPTLESSRPGKGMGYSDWTHPVPQNKK
ncbi:MAG: hypothetical protein GY930_17590 [bacterium]|nr:hypothetical protein [bacterium]